jgi:hypothetical protein
VGERDGRRAGDVFVSDGLLLESYHQDAKVRSGAGISVTVVVVRRQGVYEVLGLRYGRVPAS